MISFSQKKFITHKCHTLEQGSSNGPKPINHSSVGYFMSVKKVPNEISLSENMNLIWKDIPNLMLYACFFGPFVTYENETRNRKFHPYSCSFKNSIKKSLFLGEEKSNLLKNSFYPEGQKIMTTRNIVVITFPDSWYTMKGDGYFILKFLSRRFL